MSSRNQTATTFPERGELTPNTRRADRPRTSDDHLSTRRLNVLLFGYGFLGLAWPLSSGPSSSTPHPFP